jgi:glycosyltransferase involved in cell wall biosynthesis
VEKEALSLISSGHQVFLFCLNFNNTKPVHEEYRGINIRRYKAGKLLYKFSALAYTVPFYSWWVTYLIKDFVKSNSIQVLHIHDMVIAASVFSANTKNKLPVVLDLHENRPEIMKDYKHVNSFLGKLLINLNAWGRKYYNFAYRADCVVVVAELAKEDIMAHTGKLNHQVIVVPNTISKGEFMNYPVVQSVEKCMNGFYNLLYIGDTSLRRGTDTAIRSIALLINHIPNIRLWIVGKSSADTELRELATALNVQPYIMFEGWKDVQLLPSYIQYCNVALSPLKRNVHHDTTYANKVFQYMAMGKPIVVSDCTTQANLIREENCGLVHKANDIVNLADKILELYKNPDVSKSLGLNGVKAVNERWNWELTVKPMLSVYADLN